MLRRAWVVGVLLLASAARGADTGVPTEVFARLPVIQGVVLSPNGERFAALSHTQAGAVLITRDIEARGRKPASVLSTENQEFAIAWYRWLNNDRLVVGLRVANTRGWGRDRTETVETRLISIRADGSGLVNLGRPSAIDRNAATQQFQDRVIAWLPGGQSILLAAADGDPAIDKPDYHVDPAVFQVNAETGSRTRIRASMADVGQWLVDSQDHVRIGIRRKGLDVDVLVSDPDGANWRTAWSFKTPGADEVWPLGFDKDPNLLYVQSDHEGRAVIFTVDLRDPKLQRHLKLASKRRDILSALFRSPIGGDVVGVKGSHDGDLIADNFWDADYRAFAEKIDKALPDRINVIDSLSGDESRYVVASSSATVPTEYFVGDTRSGEFSLLGRSHPELANTKMATGLNKAFKARDGLLIPSRMTLPTAVEGPAQRLPMVVVLNEDAHGSFDPFVQLLGNRGYAVLQLKPRGTWGYGRELFLAGLRGGMLDAQTDVEDGVRAALATGVADPTRICIVGTHWGGYLAMMSLAQTPELYRCAVSLGGVSDLIEVERAARRYIGGKESVEQRLGSLSDDHDRLVATSPVYLVRKIQGPLLLLHSATDREVLFEQSQDMANAMKRADKPVKLVTLEGEAGGQRLRFFKETEAFLATNLAAPPR